MRQSSNEVGFSNKIIKTAAIFGLAGIAMTGCSGSTGNGQEIEKCKNDATTIEVTFVGDPGYKKQNDPAVLANFSADSDDVVVRDPYSGNVMGSYDYADKVGEIACVQGKATVLSTTGAKVQQYFIEEHTRSDS